MMKKILFLVILSLSLIALYSNLANAQLKVEVTPLKDILLPIDGEKAIFLIDITNDGSSPDTFSFVPSDLNWEWKYRTVEIPVNGKQSLHIELTPPKNIKAGYYTINLKIYSLNNPNIRDINPVVVQLVEFNKAIESNFIYN